MGSKRLILSGLAVLAFAAAVLLQSGHAGEDNAVRRRAGFARASGTRFTIGGRPFYSNGFNAYWLMYMASDPADRSKASGALDQASRVGAALVRTWAFSDGGYRPLQISPGVYNEDMFMALEGITRQIGPKSKRICLRRTLTGPW